MTKAQLALSLTSALVLGAPAFAHPHIFIDGRAGFAFTDDGRLSALRITWTYDAFTSLTLFEVLDLDQDRDGLLNDEDRAKIIEGETVWPDGYQGDTYLELAGAPVALTRPENASVEMSDDRITVAFDLPLAQAIAPDDALTLLLYDPNYYYAYDVVGVEDDLPAGCTAVIHDFEGDTATAALQVQLSLLSREETPEIEDVGRMFAESIELTCE